MYLGFHTLTPGDTTKVASHTTELFYTTTKQNNLLQGLPIKSPCLPDNSRFDVSRNTSLIYAGTLVAYAHALVLTLPKH